MLNKWTVEVRNIWRSIFQTAFNFTQKMSFSIKYFLSIAWKNPYSEFFWYIFSHIWTEYGEMWSVSCGKIRTRKLRIRTLFIQWNQHEKIRRKLQICLYLLKKSLSENFTFWTVQFATSELIWRHNNDLASIF